METVDSFSPWRVPKVNYIWIQHDHSFIDSMSNKVCANVETNTEGGKSIPMNWVMIISQDSMLTCDITLHCKYRYVYIVCII